MESGTRLLCLILLVCSGLLQRGEREGQCLFVLHPLSRISLFPFPFVVVCVFTFFFFQKICLCVASPHALLVFFFLLFSSPRLASRFTRCSRKETPPARSPVSISYRTVPYYITIRIPSSPSNRLTNQPHLMVHSMYLSDRKAANSSPRSSPMMCTQYFPSINITH